MQDAVAVADVGEACWKGELEEDVAAKEKKKKKRMGTVCD